MRSYYSFSLASILAVVLVAPALAQETPEAAVPSVSQQGVISYTPEDFAAARPNTALDMVNRIPGFSFDSGDEARGFAGTAGNVLIDGQRPTTKSEGLGDTLGRIPIAQVMRIDLVRGGAPGIDMQGQSVVANVIRKKEDSFQQVISVGGFLFADTGHTIPNWNYQATRRVGDHQFEFQIGRGVSIDDSVGFGWRTITDVATGDVVYENADTEGDGAPHNLRANYKGPFADGTLSINSSLGADEFKNESHFISTASDRRYVDRNANDRGEIGINYKRLLGEAFELEVLSLSKLSQGTSVSAAYEIEGVDNTTTIFRQEAESGETIGRGVLRYKLSPDLSFEGGVELAFNFRDQNVSLVQDNTPLQLSLTDVRVEELRGEVFGQSTWRLSPELSLEAGVRVERSTITQSGDLAKERSFTYPKPRVVATWSPSKDDQLRVRIEREVGQLNFGDFASSVNLSSRVESGGNSDLRPDQTWVYEAAYEKRFWDGAAAVLTLRHDEIWDVVDLLPFTVDVDTDGDGVNDAQRRLAGPGNIGSGKNDSVALNLTLPLTGVGLKGGELKFETSWQNSEVTDPLTLQKRRISGQRPNEVNIDYRQDLPDLNLTFGIGWYHGWAETYYYLEEIQKLRLRDFMASFVEWKPNPGFTLRAELKNFDPFSFNIIREIYDGPRDTGGLDTIEAERRNSQVIGNIRARWTFG